MNTGAEFKPLKVLKNLKIKSVTPLKYNYETRLKVMTYVPLKYVDKLTFELGNAGAGKIGKYDLCSFRIKGLGTYRPMRGAKPFEGKAGKISFEEEIKLEMECDVKSVDKVIDALLENHPYEEVAYEVYKFGKRSKEPVIVKVEFTRPVKLHRLISLINPRTDISNIAIDMEVRNLILADCLDIDLNLESIACKENCGLIVSVYKNKTIFKKI